MGIRKFCNSFSCEAGANCILDFWKKCITKNNKVDSRLYHTGLKSLLGNTNEDTIYSDHILTKAEGLSPRLLLMR